MNATQLHARHAYLDTRRNNQHVWHIRIYAVIIGKAIYARESLYCLLSLRDDERNNPNVVAQAYIYEKDMKEIVFNGQLVHRVLISCRVPRYVHVTAVYVTSHVPCTLSPYSVPLEVKPIESSRTAPKHVGICVPLSYGMFTDADALRLVEWVELNRIFGVYEINIYNVTMSVSDEYRRVLEYYITENIIRLYNIPPPIEHYAPNNLYNVSKMIDLVLLNECMMENMYRYKYIVVIDLDEVIVPRQDMRNYASLVESSNVYGWRTQPIASYLVQQVFFYINIDGNVDQPEHLVSLRHTIRIGNGSDQSNPKQITNPRLCIHAYIHYCDQIYSTDDLDHSGFALGYIKPTSMLVHHYRKSCEAKWRPGVKAEDAIVRNRCRRVRQQLRHRSGGNSGAYLSDTYMWRFSSQLEPAVNAVITVLDLWHIRPNPQNLFHIPDLSKPKFVLEHYAKLQAQTEESR